MIRRAGRAVCQQAPNTVLVLHVALGHPARFELSSDDFCLHVPGTHGQLLLLANAYDGGFSTCFSRGSRLFLELFRQSWEEQSFQVERQPRRALRLSFCQSARRFLTATKVWVDKGGDLDLGGIAATATAVYIMKQRALCCWLGNEHAGVSQNGHLLVENVIDTTAARAATVGQKGHSSLKFSISDRHELEPQLVDWQLPSPCEVVLALKSFPNSMKLQELLPLFALNSREAGKWCEKNDTGFYCLMKWTLFG